MRRWTVMLSFVIGFTLLGIVIVAIQGDGLRPTAVALAAADLVATNDGPTPLGEVTTISATLSQTGFDYTWDLGDGGSATGAVVTHTYAMVGDFTAAVTATDGSQTYHDTTTVSVDVPVMAPLLEEGFEGGFPPTGWLRSRQTAVSQHWGPSSAIAHSGAGCALHDDLALPPGGMQDAWLVSTQVTPTSESQLVFWQWQKYVHRYYKHSVWLSTDNQDPKYDDFVELLEGGPGTERVWEEVRVDLSSYAGQPIYLAFRYEGDNAAEWAIDDVQVTSALLASHDGPKEVKETVTFATQAATGSRVSYTWDFGDGETGSGDLVTHTYTALGDYTAVVTASNSINSVTKTLSVPIRSYIYLPLVVRE